MMEFKNAARPRGILAPLCLVAVLLQVALAPQVSVLGGRFNFMLVLVAVLAVRGDSRTMVWVGFAAGLFYDLTAAVPVGLMALLLAVAGYIAALAARGLTPGLTMEALRLTALVILGVNLVYALALFLLGSEGNLLVALGVHGLASSVLCLVAACPALAVLGGREAARGFSARRGHGGRYKGIR